MTYALGIPVDWKGTISKLHRRQESRNTVPYYFVLDNYPSGLRNGDFISAKRSKGLRVINNRTAESRCFANQTLNAPNPATTPATVHNNINNTR